MARYAQSPLGDHSSGQQKVRHRSSLPICGINNLAEQICTELGRDQGVEASDCSGARNQPAGVWWEGEMNETRRETLHGERVTSKSHSPVHLQVLCCTSLE